MRRKRRLTRRQRALRALAILVFMVLYAVIPGRYYFLPSQAIRDDERLGNIGSTQLIYEFPEEGRMLRGNDRGLMVCTLRNYVAFRGWEAEYYCAFLDCTKPGPFHVGFCRSLHGADWYGRIDDPAAAAVRLEYYVFEQGEKPEKTFTIEKEDWIEWGGNLYFALEFEQDIWPLYNRAHSELLDSEGNVIGSQDIFLDSFSDAGRRGKALHQ